MRTFLLVISVFIGLLAGPVAAQVVLSECLASNRSGVRDRDGLHAGWVELHNAGDRSELLTDRVLADGEGHSWRFPAITLAPRNYLVVYLTGKDRRDTSRPLHSSFRLGRGGGLLRLLDRDGTTELSRLEYERQHDDVSYGLEQTFSTVALVEPCSAARYLVPRGGVPEAWLLPDFNDHNWSEGFGGFGFCNSDRQGIREWIGTDVAAAMRGEATTACFRHRFEVADSDGLTSALLRVRCVGGYVAWLNGTEIARVNAPDDIGPGAEALTWTDGADLRLVHDTDVALFSALLRKESNILAVQSFSPQEYAFDHLVMAELWAYRPGSLRPQAPVHFDAPTPGRPNGTGHARLAKRPRFAQESRLTVGAGRVGLGKAGKGTVRYTVDGSTPIISSPAFDGELDLARSTVVKARRFRDGRAPSPTAAVHCTRLADDLKDYRSDLPLLVVSTHGAPVETKEWIDGHIHAIDRDADGVAMLGGPAQVSTPGGIRLRGSSTLNLPKRSYAIELREDGGRGRDVPLFGLPAAADWVLYAPHNYDQSHFRNALCYELARRLGLPSPRWQFVELFVDTDGGMVTRADYKGLYLLVERIAPSMERVEIDEVGPLDATAPAITGGYILKIDRPAPGDEGFDSGGQQLQFVAPKEREITDPQRAFLQQWFDRFGSALSGPEFTDPERGYAAFIEVDNFIDFHFFHEYTKNPDAFTLSTYMHKPRGGKLRMGPIWDFDRGLRTNAASYWVGRGARPDGWTGDTYHGWWGILFRDPEFRARYRERGRRWLATELSVERVHALVGEIARGIAAAEERDRKRWPIINAGKWRDEIHDLENWIVARTVRFDELRREQLNRDRRDEKADYERLELDRKRLEESYRKLDLSRDDVRKQLEQARRQAEAQLEQAQRQLETKRRDLQSDAEMLEKSKKSAEEDFRRTGANIDRTREFYEQARRDATGRAVFDKRDAEALERARKEGEVRGDTQKVESVDLEPREQKARIKKQKESKESKESKKSDRRRRVYDR